MRKEFRIIFDTNQSDVQCRLAFEHAVGELTQNRPEIKKIISGDNCQFCGADLSPNHPLKNEPQTNN